jgi:Mrp family chromosome partitioning ATPase/DUF971 family protein
MIVRQPRDARRAGGMARLEVVSLVLLLLAGLLSSGAFVLPSSAKRARYRPAAVASLAAALSPQQVQELESTLRTVIDPDLNQDIVSLGFVKDVSLEQGVLAFNVELTTPACPIKEDFQRQCKELAEGLEWVSSAQVTMTSQPVKERVGAPTGLSRVRNIIAVGSCKGGVGKSTTAVNLAYALNAAGARVGLLDTDVYGPSLPTMVKPDSPEVQFVENEILPLEAGGVKLMSYGYVNPGSAIMRGPMVVQLLQQFVSLTSWGELDYLVLDLPPGTGDIQLTLCQSLNITAAVIVTTPSRLAFTDVVKGIDMFDAVGVPSIAVVENMAYQDGKLNEDLLPAAVAAEVSKKLKGGELSPGAIEGAVQAVLKDPSLRVREQPFGAGHTQRLTSMWGIESVVRVPLERAIAAGGDSGTPFYTGGAGVDIYDELASAVVMEVAKINSGSSGRPDVSYDESSHHISIKLAGTEETMKPAALRRACRCAVCVEEMTGRPLLDPESVSESIQPLGFATIGNYAVSVDWSDGHKSLYPYTSFVKGYAGRTRREISNLQQQEETATAA